jgi:hypothetical protein
VPAAIGVDVATELHSDKTAKKNILKAASAVHSELRVSDMGIMIPTHRFAVENLATLYHLQR